MPKLKGDVSTSRSLIRRLFSKTRDRVCSLSVGVLAAAAVMTVGALTTPAVAEPSHGISAFGDLKYPADFTHFEYVDPSAPKGGRLALVGTRGLSTFDSFNGYILKGDAAQGTSLLF